MQKTLTRLFIGMAVFLFLATSCKSRKVPLTIKHDLTTNDTIIRHEVESIILPQRNYVVFENPCKEDSLSLPTQIVENEHSTVTIGAKDETLFVQVDIDSIVNARLSETHLKSKVERVEVPVEVPYPVKNKLNWYLVMYSVGATLVIFRKPIFYVVRKLIMPIP